MSLRKTETVVFRVALDVPVGANAKDCEDYIRQAVRDWKTANLVKWGESMFPVPRNSPMLNLDVDQVRVSILERHTLYVNSGNHGGGKRKRPTRDNSTS